ncbi:MAG TPA: 2-C-methyl-D-erythritol 2,4-cyclodiphosphate synthase [Gemmatales bacterium]|nr:2-C-methyl-D-erythritol 2,4-cyclodiphosphate synthase [Gemmatales bacterium]
MRVGLGHDTHRLVTGRPLIMAGLRIEHSKGLAGHSDADVVLHAVIDALLGAAGLGDIGDAFPDDDPENLNADSVLFLETTMARLYVKGFKLINVDIIIHAEQPKLGPIKTLLRENLSKLLGLSIDRVNVKAKTGEHVGHIGRGEAIAVHAVVLLDDGEHEGSETL